MSDIDEVSDKILSADSRTLAPAAVASQIALMSVISVVTVLAFNILRPKNKIIYEPKVKYHVGSKPPPKISDSLFGWLPPLLHTKEPELIEKIGLDACTFLRFTRLLRWLFTGITVLTCGILIPVNVAHNLREVNKDNRDILSMLTIRDVSGNILFAHVAVTYLITFLICGFVYVHWKRMVELRYNWFRSPEYMESFYARTLAILHVPKRHQSDEGIREIFGSTQVPYPTTSVHIGRKVGQLPQLIEYHNQTVRELERHLVKYLKNGQVGKKRPTITVGGTLGIGGTKKDAIDYYTAKLKRTEAAVEECRRQFNTRKPENYGFASMAAVPYAHIVAKILHNKHPKGTDITLAPNPKDIIWANIDMSEGEIARKKIHGFIWLVVVCFFNTVPLLIISVLANLDTLTAYVGFLDQWKKASEGSFTFVSGVLPPAVSAIFGFFLPIIMRWLSRYMGALTHSRLDRAVVARYFAFLVISQLVIFTLIGVLFSCVKQIVLAIGKKSFREIVNNLSALPDTINRTYVDQSSYWLTFFPLRGFLVIFDLAQIINLVWIFIKTRLFGRTPRDIREWTQPPDFEYAIYYSNLLLMCAVAMVFAPLAPLVALAATIVFWISSWVYKYQLMFVFTSKVETGGRMWNVVINRLLFCVVLMQALMILTIGLQYGFKNLQWISTIPPIFIMIGFKIYINNNFDSKFRFYSPTEDELRLAKVHSERADNKGNRLEKRFGHPALNADLFTPMLHANMMPLLGQVYSGKIAKDKAQLNEYGGQKLDAHVVGEGIKIAAVSQHDLEYDPVLYQRDRGELDWDARSISSTAYLNDGASIMHHKAGSQDFYASSTTLLPGYDRYLANGPNSGNKEPETYELSRMDSSHEPLLSPTSLYYQNQQSTASQQSLIPPTLYREQSNEPYRQAPLHRQQPSGSSYSLPDGTPIQRTMSPLQERSGSPYGNPYANRSQTPLVDRTGTPLQQQHSPQQEYPPQPRRQGSFGPERAMSPAQPQRQYSQDQLSRPQPSRQGSFGPERAMSPYQQQSQPQYSHNQHPSQGSVNMAGRGAHRLS